MAGQTFLTPLAAAAAFGPLPLVTLTDRADAPDARLPLATQDCNCDCACTVAQPSPRAPLAAPVACYLELTAVCPQQCVGCGNVFIDRGRAAPPHPPLSAVQWQAIIDKLRPSVSLVRLTGGEPTAHPEFLTIVDHLAAAGLPFALLTSGRWARPRRLVERLAGCASFRGMLISLHGPDAAVHEAFTHATGSFRAAAAAIRLAVGQGIAVAASVVMVRANLGRLRDTAETALALGANHVVFNRFIGPPGVGFALPDEGLRAAMGEVKALADAGYPVRFGNCIPHCFEPSVALGCSAGFSYCTVDPWGNVRPCNHAPWLAGNLLRDELAAIWDSATMQRWRGLSPAECHDCPAHALCLGGCHAVALGRDPLMAVALPSAPARPSPAAIILFAGATPLPRFALLPDEPEVCAVSEGRALRLPAAVRPLLSDLAGHKNLAQLESTWGSVGLAVVVWLYQQHFIDLTYPPEPVVAAPQAPAVPYDL